MIVLDKYRITADLNVKTDITSLTLSPDRTSCDTSYNVCQDLKNLHYDLSVLNVIMRCHTNPYLPVSALVR